MATCPISIRWKTVPVWLQVNNAHDDDLLPRAQTSSDASSEWHSLWKTRIDQNSQPSIVSSPKMSSHKNVNSLTRRHDGSSLMGEMRPGLPSESTFCNTSDKKDQANYTQHVRVQGVITPRVQHVWWLRLTQNLTAWHNVTPRPQGLTGGGMGLLG